MNFNTGRTELEIFRIIYRSIPLKSYKERHRPSSSFVYYIKGGHRFDFGEYKIEAKEGEMVFIPFGSTYTNYTISSDTEYYQFDFNFLNMNKPYSLWEKARVFDSKQALKYLPLFKELYDMHAIHDDGYNLFCSSRIMKITEMLYRDEKQVKENACAGKKIEKTINHLNEFYYLDTPVDMLAKMSSISISNLEKTFKSQMGVPPLTYRHKIRIEHAKLFLSGGYSIAETASKVGFSDVYYFSKIFKKICGITPGKFSKENKMI